MDEREGFHKVDADKWCHWSLGPLCLDHPDFFILDFATGLVASCQNVMEQMATFTLYKVQHFLTPARDAALLTTSLVKKYPGFDHQSRLDLEQYFYDQLFLHDSFTGMYIGRPNGEFLYVSRNDTKEPDGFRTKIITFDRGVRLTELIWKNPAGRETSREYDEADTYDPTQRPWYIGVEKQRKTILTEPYVFYTSKLPGVTFASPVLDTAGELVAVVGVDIELVQLSTFLSSCKWARTGLLIF